MINVEAIAIKAGMKVGTNISGVRLVGSPCGTSIAHLTVDDMKQLINLVLEEAANMCESLFDMTDDSCNEAEQCAAAIRMLKAK